MVHAEIQDDQYTPAHARQVCSAMAKRDFLVVGGGGTDQIQACATEPYIHSNNVPYLSAGVTDNGLNNLSNYFAISLTYQQQGTLVLKNAQAQGIADPAASTIDSDNMPGQKAKWAIVTASSASASGSVCRASSTTASIASAARSTTASAAVASAAMSPTA